MKPQEIVALKLRTMDEELKYLRGFFNWLLETKDKSYREVQEFNEQFTGKIPVKYIKGD